MLFTFFNYSLLKLDIVLSVMISDRPRHKVRRRPRMISSNPDIRIHHNIIFFMDHIHKRQPIPAVLLIELFVSGCWTTAPEEKINLLGILLLLLLGDSGSVLITDLTLDTHKVGNITHAVDRQPDPQNSGNGSGG